MKRKSNLYNDMCNINNIIDAVNEVCRNTKNKRKINSYKDFKCINVYKVYNNLVNREYEVGPYNTFIIHEPKERKIVSQSIYDKVVNHLIARKILIPALNHRLIDQNVASRPGMGTKKKFKLYNENKLSLKKIVDVIVSYKYITGKFPY